MTIGHGAREKDDLLHYPIKYAIVHQRYDKYKKDYDIGLVRTSSPLELSESPPYINIEQLPRNFVAYMYGRGKASNEAYVKFPDPVRYVKIHDDRRDCELEDEFKNTDVMMCYHLVSIEESFTEGRTAQTFYGDSGSPIIADDLYKKDTRYLIGIHTRRNPLSALNGEEVRAGVNIAYFIEWIHYVANKDWSEEDIKNSDGKLRCCDSKTEDKIKWQVPLHERSFLNISSFVIKKLLVKF